MVPLRVGKLTNHWDGILKLGKNFVTNIHAMAIRHISEKPQKLTFYKNNENYICLWIVNIFHSETVEWHECYFTRQFLLVHFLQDLCTNLVRFHNVMEQPEIKTYFLMTVISYGLKF